MTLAALPFAVGAGGVLVAALATSAALRVRATARADRVALRLGRERERSFSLLARRLAEATRHGTDAVRAEIARAAAEEAPAVDAALLYEERDGALRCVFAAGDRVAYFAGSEVALDDRTAPAARAIAAEHRITLADPGVQAIHPADVAVVAVPLASDPGRGTALVLCARSALDGESVERLVAFAELAAPAYALARDREDDRQRAEYDGLTGLLTPRAFRARLALMVERARYDPSAQIALVFADTDRFKEWNDAYGHAAGDALLREIARVLRSVAVPERDLVARNGGDEFCIVFAQTGKAAAIERAEAVRRRIAALDVAALRPHGAQPEVRITASLGVSALVADARSASELLERADAAMYHTKHTGRDGVSYRTPQGEFARLAGPA